MSARCRQRTNIWLALGLMLVLALPGGTPAWGQQAASDLSELLSSEGTVYFGSSPNSIMVIDYPENIKNVESYLRMVDVSPRQVLIEARVVEVKLQGQHALGINWSLFAEKGGADLGYVNLGGSSGTSPIEQDIPYKNTSYPPGSTSATSEDPFSITIFDENINVILQTLANSFDTNILSAPRVTAVNNQEAEIRVVEELRWVVPQIQVDEGTVSLSWEEPEDSPRDVGISLSATPMITEDGDIFMELRPEISEHVRDIDLTAVAGNTTVDYSIPIVDTRNAHTKVVIGNGQTLIIGGLIKEKMTKGESKIPLLGDIPYLGYLFKSTLDTKEKSELLIFVSPTVISADVKDRMRRKDEAAWYLNDEESDQETKPGIDPPFAVWGARQPSAKAPMEGERKIAVAVAPEMDEPAASSEEPLDTIEETISSIRRQIEVNMAMSNYLLRQSGGAKDER